MTNKMETVSWPGWETVRLIGHGSFGEVHEIRRDVLGNMEKAALKVLAIPQSDSEIEDMQGNGYDQESITSTFRGHLEQIVGEYMMMRKLSFCINVVHCEDVRYIQHDDGIGWDIFIKMELLTPIMKALPAQIPEEMAVKLGADICTALIECKKLGIIHRDIKPQNIFVSEHGDYKLGDFGIAKTVERTMGGTKIGTYKYMAPEVYNNQPYGSSADLYSLGLVLYWMLNDRRMPFLPSPPEKIKVGMEEEARLRRLSGEKLPPPAHGSEGLKRAVLRACAYDPKDRFASPEEFRAALLGQAVVEKPNIPVGPVDVPTPPTPPTLPTPKPVSQPKPTTIVWDSPRTQHGGTKARVVAIAGGDYHSVALRADGTVIATGSSAYGRCDVNAWKEITQISAGDMHTVGLRTDGSVVATGSNLYGQCAVSDWKDVKTVVAGSGLTLGIRRDGTVLGVGQNRNGQCNVHRWSNIIAISSRNNHTVGLRADGTVLVTGLNNYGQCEVSGWRNIIAIATGDYYTVGLRSDGTVVTAGEMPGCLKQISANKWSNITAICSGGYHIVGLRSDGTVVVDKVNLDERKYLVSSWTDIVSISTGEYHILGLKSDGSVVATGWNFDGRCNIMNNSWLN